MVWSRAWSDVWHDLDGIAASITISIINYILLGLEFPVDGFYMHSFEIWLATTVVFIGSGNVGFTLLEYRLGEKPIVCSFTTSRTHHFLRLLLADERPFPELDVDSILVRHRFLPTVLRRR